MSDPKKQIFVDSNKIPKGDPFKDFCLNANLWFFSYSCGNCANFRLLYHKKIPIISRIFKSGKIIGRCRKMMDAGLNDVDIHIKEGFRGSMKVCRKNEAGEEEVLMKELKDYSLHCCNYANCISAPLLEKRQAAVRQD